MIPHKHFKLENGFDVYISPGEYFYCWIRVYYDLPPTSGLGATCEIHKKPRSIYEIRHYARCLKKCIRMIEEKIKEDQLVPEVMK